MYAFNNNIYLGPRPTINYNIIEEFNRFIPQDADQYRLTKYKMGAAFYDLPLRFYSKELWGGQGLSFFKKCMDHPNILQVCMTKQTKLEKETLCSSTCELEIERIKNEWRELTGSDDPMAPIPPGAMERAALRRRFGCSGFAGDSLDRLFMFVCLAAFVVLRRGRKESPR